MTDLEAKNQAQQNGTPEVLDTPEAVSAVTETTATAQASMDKLQDDIKTQIAVKDEVKALNTDVTGNKEWWDNWTDSNQPSTGSVEWNNESAEKTDVTGNTTWWDNWVEANQSSNSVEWNNGSVAKVDNIWEPESVSQVYVVNEHMLSLPSDLDLTEYQWYVAALDQLLADIQRIENEISKKWLSKSGKQTMEQAKNKLKSYKKDILAKKRIIEQAYKKNWGRTFDANEINDIKRRRTVINRVFEDVKRWQAGELWVSAPYNYNASDSSRRSNRQKENLWDYERKYREEVKQWAILDIFNNNEQQAIDFYRRIAEWNYTQADYFQYVACQNILAPSFQRCWMPLPVERITLSNTSRPAIDYSNETLWSSFQKWWISGLLDKALSNCNNLTPGQRNTRKTLWVLWVIWWAIYWWYKFLTSKKLKFWWKAWIVAWSFLLPELLIWENPITLFNKLLTGWLSLDEIKDKLGNAFGSLWNSSNPEVAELAPAMCSLMMFDTSTKVSDIRTLSQQFRNDAAAWPQFYKATCAKLNTQGKNGVEYFRATFPEDHFDEVKWKTRLATFWVADSTADDTLIYEIANNATLNSVTIEKYMAENWLKVNAAHKAEFNNFKNGKKQKNELILLRELQEKENLGWFVVDTKATYTEREEDKKQIKLLTQKVVNLHLNQDKEKELIGAVTELYNSRTIDTKPVDLDFDLSLDENGLLILTSQHWEKRKINLDRKTLCGFGSNNGNDYEIPFTSLSDLLDTADLTNKILSIEKGQKIAEYPPFKKEYKAICFNNAKLLSFDMDTRVLSTWIRGQSKNFTTIDNHLDSYVSYLSQEWMNDNKFEIDVDKYPMVKKLESVWITFINGEEVANLEALLNAIKTQNFGAVPTLTWSPFDIRYTLKVWEWKKIIFTNVNDKNKVFEADMSQFPTILNNKDAFLSFMNDPQNLMRWSVEQNQVPRQ